MARPSNPSGYFTPSFPTPAIIGAQGSQALFQENQWEPSIGARAPQLGHPSAVDTLVPPAVAPQTFHFQFQPESQPHMTMPQAGVPNAMPLQHFSGTAAVQPLHGNELAARVAAINTLPYQPFQPNNYAHGWFQDQLMPPQQQAPPALRYAALQPAVEQGDSGYHLQPPPPQDAHILQRSMMAMAPPNWNSAAPAVATDGYDATSWARPMLPPSDWPGSWAPPVQQPGADGQTSWAWAPPAQQRPGMPAASPASGSAQAQPPRVTGKKTFEEFLLEAGILDQQTVNKIFVDELAEEMLGDGQAERDDRFVSLGDLLLALGAVSSSSSGAGPSTHQVRMPAQEALGAGTSGGGGRDEAAAAEARERRSRRMAMRKEAAARHHRPDKHAGIDYSASFQKIFFLQL